MSETRWEGVIRLEAVSGIWNAAHTRKMFLRIHRRREVRYGLNFQIARIHPESCIGMHQMWGAEL